MNNSPKCNFCDNITTKAGIIDDDYEQFFCYNHSQCLVNYLYHKINRHDSFLREIRFFYIKNVKYNSVTMDLISKNTTIITNNYHTEIVIPHLDLTPCNIHNRIQTYMTFQ